MTRLDRNYSTFSRRQIMIASAGGIGHFGGARCANFPPFPNKIANPVCAGAFSREREAIPAFLENLKSITSKSRKVKTANICLSAGAIGITGLATMRFDLTDLRLFLSVVESASITQGASNAHLTAASASERIRNMEHEIGTQLLLREARGVRPTPAGSVLARHARTILQQNEIMRGELFEFADGLRGRVRLLTNTAGLYEFLPAMLADYLLTYPKIDLEIAERPSQDIVQAISSGDFDAGLVADIVPTGQLKRLPCFVDQLVLIVPAQHLFSDLKEIEFARAVTQDFVGLMGDSALMEHLEWQASRLTQSIHWRVQLSTFEAVCDLVERGVGVAVVPERAAEKARTKGSDLVVVRLSDSWARRQLLLCVRDLDELSKHARLFVDHMMSKAEA